jgi:nitroreductase
MSDFIEVIKQRRSVRKFEEKEIPDDIIQEILEAVQWSPSWANTQCWEIVVIKDNNVKEQLQQTIAPKNPATKAVANAPVVFAVCGKLNTSGYYNGSVTTKFGDWFMFDLGIATQSLCLTAHELGLGTVVVGLLDQDKAKEIVKVPEGFELVVLIPCGYPSKISSAPERKNIKDFTHYDHFNTKR